MQIYDVTVPISADTVTYPGDPGVDIQQWLSLSNGDAANVTMLHFGAHTGTHVDAPAHFLKGARGVGELRLETLIGEASVVEIPESVSVIDAAIVDEFCPANAARILLKTRNSAFWSETQRNFHPDYTYVSPEGAKRLVDNGVELIGIDYLSIEQFAPAKFETHEILLSQGVVIIETLDLRTVPAGTYELICLPLRIASGSGDGAPARVVLRNIMI